MKSVFLESHNIKNKFSGFGQFNYHLIKALAALQDSEIQFTLHSKNIDVLKKEFGNTFQYKKYQSLSRHTPFRIKKKYDIWHSLNQNIKIEPFFNIPYVLTVHDIHFVTEGSISLQQKLRKHFEKKIARANAIVYISNFAKQDTHKHFEIPSIDEYVIHNGNPITTIDIPTGYTPKKIPKNPYLFSIGEFTTRKNFKSLVKMLVHLPQYDLVLSGNNKTDDANAIFEEIERQNLKNRVYITGKINDTEKQYYLKNCTAFVFPSLREGFGIPPIEAMRFGKPVFISNNTSLPEIGGEHAFYWDHYEPKYMATILEEGLEKYNANSAFYKNWYIERSKYFNWNRTAKEYLKVYHKLLK